MINMYNSILRGLPIGGASPAAMSPAPALTGVPSPVQAPAQSKPAVPAQAGAPPAPSQGVGQIWNKLMSDPDIARALLSFGSTALQAREQGLGFGAGFAGAAEQGVQTMDLTREKRLALKRQLLKDNLENSKTRNELRMQEMALEDARLEREALAEMAGSDPQMAALSRIDPKSLIKLKYPQLMNDGTTPAAIQIANEIAKARKDGNVQRVNDLMMAGKLLEKGQNLDGSGSVVNMEGFVPAVADVAGGKATAEEQGKQDVKLEMEPKVEAAKKEATNAVEKKSIYPKAAATLRSTAQSYKNVDGEIDKALKASNGWTTGFFGKVGSFVPGSDANDLEQRLVTIKANLGFDKLQDMRNNSPTGGALGSIAVQELQALQSVWNNLEQSQSKAQFDDNLRSLKEQRKQTWSNIKKAYVQDFGSVEGFEAPEDESNAPKPASWSDVGNGFKIRRKQ